MASPLLDLQDLRVFHGRFQALHGVDMQVNSGEVVALIGANGAGKTSLLRALMGKVDRCDGVVMWQGTALGAMPATERVQRGLALVPEGRRLFPSLTVAENLGIGLTLGRQRSGPSAETAARFGLDDVLDIFPALRPLLEREACRLSGGQQQMVAIGRALLMRPTLLMCDEMSLGLAPRVIEELYAVLPGIQARGVSLLIVEQDLTRALAVADRFYCLLEGRVTLSGRPENTARATIERHYFGLPSGEVDLPHA